jgi:hypothetical protein
VELRTWEQKYRARGLTRPLNDEFSSNDKTVNSKSDFSLFLPIAVSQTVALNISFPSKSSPLDPLPTPLLRNLLNSWLFQLRIINLSLFSGFFSRWDLN